MTDKPAHTGTVTSIRTQARNPDRVSVFVDGTYSFGIHRQLLTQFGVAIGASIQQNALDQLLLEDRKLRAVSRGVYYVAHRPRTGAEVKLRMVRYGYAEDEVAFVVERLASMGLINDADYAETFARTRFAAKGHGPNRIRHDLQRKGVAPGVIEAVVALFDDQEELAEAAKNLLEKRLLSLSKEVDTVKRRRKGIAYLVRRGYSYALATQLVDQAFRT